MRAILALEDGLTFSGESFTGPGESSGEVIFNTGMTGYQEVLTDPSYTGQMVSMTYPLIGNYGVNPEDVESSKIRVASFIVKECCKIPSNWRSTMSLPDYLISQNVMGIEGIDTRALTRHLRLHGAKRGIISTEELDPGKLARRAQDLPTMEGLNLADTVTPEKPYIWIGKTIQEAVIKPDGGYDWPGPGPRVVLVDCGVKWNILRLLSSYDLDLLMVPSSYTKEQIDALAPHAVFLSPGPGDPRRPAPRGGHRAQAHRQLPHCGHLPGAPTAGGAHWAPTTFKLKFGHHGCNHPVLDLENGHIEISSPEPRLLRGR